MSLHTFGMFKVKATPSGIVTAVACVAAVVWVRTLALELLHAIGVAKKIILTHEPRANYK